MITAYYSPISQYKAPYVSAAAAAAAAKSL